MLAAIKGLQTPDYFVLLGYFALMLGVGVYFSRYMKGARDFFNGGNRIPWWLSGASFYMSVFSVFMFVVYTELGYKYGLIAVVIQWSTVIAVVVSVLFLAKRWRRARINSPVEYLESRYSSLVKQLFVWEGIPPIIADNAMRLVATASFMSVALKMDPNLSLLLCGVIVLVFTMLGGLWAVTVTDFVQFIVLLIAVIILVPLSLSRVDWGVNFLDGLPEGFLHFTHPPKYNVLFLLGVTLMSILYISSLGWSLIQRYYCVPTEKDAYKMGWFVALLFFVGQPLILLPALLARKFMTIAPDDPCYYATICLELLPTGMMGLMLSAMFAATMSTLSSDYNVCAGVLTNDVYLRYIRPNASQKELVLAGRVLTLVFGLLCLLIGYMFINLGGEGLFNKMLTVFGVFTAPVAVPMISGLIFHKISNRGALLGFLVGVLTGLVLLWRLPDEISLLGQVLRNQTILIFATTIATVLSLMIFNRIFPQKADEHKRAQAFAQKLRIPIGQLDEDRSSLGREGTESISPFWAIGLFILLIGFLVISILPFLEKGLTFIINLAVVLVLLLMGSGMMLYGRKNSSRKTDTKNLV